MTDPTRTRRRELLRPSHLLGLSFGAAVFAGVVVLVSMGFFQSKGDILQPFVMQQALFMSGICAGLSFAAMIVGLPLLLLCVRPTDFPKEFAGPVLFDDFEQTDPLARPAAVTDRQPQ